jgi:SAM-dependent methyltransferase
MAPPLVRPAEPRNVSEICREWDRLAGLRFEQISSGRDFSYSRILEPTILNLLKQRPFSSVLDVGCGVGVLTRRIADLCDTVVGLDVSEGSISVARQHTQPTSSLKFVAESVESFAARTAEKFDVVVSNMMLMSTPNLRAAVNAMAGLLAPAGRMIITITHPWFWPKYWGYESAAWFEYEREIVLEAPFTISTDGPSPFLITHIHRPLEQYVTGFVSCGLCMTGMSEPSPPDDTPADYRSHWEFPRFLTFTCTHIDR